MQALRESTSCWRQVLVLLTLAGVISYPAFGQVPSSPSPSPPLTLARREKLARPILLHAERSAAGFDPSSRTLLLYRAAGAWLGLDPAHAIRLYREAFALALKFEPASIRPSVEAAVLNDLLPLSPSDVLELLPSADAKTQDRLYRAAINSPLTQSDYATAVRAFDQACASGHFSHQAVTHLIANLGDAGAVVAPFVSNEALRTHVFNSAFQTYKGLDPSQIESWSASRIIARFYAEFPAEVVLPAIDIVLEQAEKKDKANPVGSGSIGSFDHSLSYTSRYDLELFVVAPALQRFDPERATLLLTEHPKVAEYLQRFPKGLLSFDLRESYPTSYRLNGPSSHFMPTGLQLYNSDKGAHSTGLSSLDMGLEFTITLDLNIGLGVTGSGVFYASPGSPESDVYRKIGGCPNDLERRLDPVRSVPLSRKVETTCGGPLNAQWCSYEDDFPRAGLLQAIAQDCTAARNDASAHVALHEQIELISQLEPEQQTQYLAFAADLYLRLGDQSGAAAVVKQGFATASTLFQRELAAPALKDFPKAMWPAAETYRRMINLGVNSDLASTQDMASRIADPSLRELEQVMVARALLGVPVRRYMVMSPQGALQVVEVETTYDQF